MNTKGEEVLTRTVGGKTLQMVIDKVNKGARIVICGDVSSYNTSQPTGGSKAYAPTGQVGVTVSGLSTPIQHITPI